MDQTGLLLRGGGKRRRDADGQEAGDRRLSQRGVLVFCIDYRTLGMVEENCFC